MAHCLRGMFLRRILVHVRRAMLFDLNDTFAHYLCANTCARLRSANTVKKRSKLQECRFPPSDQVSDDGGEEETKPWNATSSYTARQSQYSEFGIFTKTFEDANGKVRTMRPASNNSAPFREAITKRGRTGTRTTTPRRSCTPSTIRRSPMSIGITRFG